MTEIVAFVGACIVAGLIVWLALANDAKWKAFSAAHDCKIVGKSTGHTSTGFGVMPSGGMGPVVTYTPGKTGFACNDGVTYWR